MRIGLSTVFALTIVLSASTAAAQKSGSASGRYATHTVADEVTAMPDGSSMILSHYGQISFAEDGEHPIDNVSLDCIGKIEVSADGLVTAGNGSCFGVDKDGDGTSFWWRMTQARTADCSDICGEWGYFAGDGKFAGIEGGGIWQRTTLFQDGSSGTWTGRYMIP